MKRTLGSNVSAMVDSTGALVFVDWICPYCGEYHSTQFFTSNTTVKNGWFETDQECDSCGKEVTIECHDVTIE